MKERKALKRRCGEKREEDVIRRLEGMLEDSKLLCQTADPILQGQMQVILGMLADILEAKDPERSFHHVVEFE
jgi:hypothetical protein